MSNEEPFFGGFQPGKAAFWGLLLHLLNHLNHPSPTRRRVLGLTSPDTCPGAPSTNSRSHDHILGLNPAELHLGELLDHPPPSSAPNEEMVFFGGLTSPATCPGVLSTIYVQLEVPWPIRSHILGFQPGRAASWSLLNQTSASNEDPQFGGLTSPDTSPGALSTKLRSRG